MALIYCPECGKEMSDQSDKCPGCGFPLEKMIQRSAYENQPDTFNCKSCSRPIPVGSEECIYCGEKYVANTRKKILCPECGSSHIDISFVQTGASTSTCNVGTATKLGRKAMKGTTFGAWNLTGARTSKSNTNFRNSKIAICNDCGHSWNYMSDSDKKIVKNILSIIGILVMLFMAWLYLP